MLFTRCPECHTTFRISEEMLSKAAGQVRCGRCSNIFDARLELHESDGAPKAGGAPAVNEPNASPEVRDAPADSKNRLRAVAAISERTAPGDEPAPDLHDPDPFSAADLWTLEPAATSPPRGNRRWAVAAAVASLLLVVQITNSFSDVLATRVPLVQRAYAALGLELVPRWDLDRYEVVRATAATKPGESGRGDLVITARIRNRGTLPQPHPHLQLRLLDRWERTVGKRAFAPADYGAASASRDAMLAPGDSIMAELVVVDPGPDAAGFEVDVCIVAATGLRCAANNVFE